MKSVINNKTRPLNQKQVDLLPDQDQHKLFINSISKEKKKVKNHRTIKNKKDQDIQNLFKFRNKQQNLFKHKRMKIR